MSHFYHELSDNTAFFSRIRLRRIELGLSQDYIAFQLAITQSFYSRIERGLQRISKSQYEKLLEVLELDNSIVQFQNEEPLRELRIQELQNLVELLNREVDYLREQNIYLSKISMNK